MIYIAEQRQRVATLTSNSSRFFSNTSSLPAYISVIYSKELRGIGKTSSIGMTVFSRRLVRSVFRSIQP